MLSILVFFGRFGRWLWFSSRAKWCYDKLYQWVWQRQYKNLALPVFVDTNATSAQLKQFKWRADGLRELGDATSTPQAFWAAFKADPTKGEGDCEDFANFNCYCINQSTAHGIWKDPVWTTAQMLCISWVDSKGVPDGHCVGLLSGVENGNPVYTYQDYGDVHAKVGSVEEVVTMVLNDYVKNGWTSLGWCVLESGSLNLVRNSWK
jgi:hypothetical protein